MFEPWEENNTVWELFGAYLETLGFDVYSFFYGE